jgi:hypothetical protein
MRKGTEFTCANLDSLSGILHTQKIIVRAHARFRGLVLNQRNRLRVGSGFVRLEAVSIAQYQGGIQGTVEGSSRGVHHALPESYPVSHSVTGEFIPRICEGVRF